VQSKIGAVLNNNTLNDDVARIQDLYRQRGFAALVTEVKQQEDGTVLFIIQEAKVSKVNISGLKKTRESLLRKLIRTKPEDAFDQRRLQQDLNRLYDTGFFEDVTYKLDDDPDKAGYLIITIGIKEKRTGTFTLGVGFDSRSKISGFLTLSETNFRGTGRRVAGSVEIGSVRTFDISYGNPFVGNRNASYNASLYSRRIYREPRAVNLITGQPEDAFYEERRTGGRVDYTMPLDYDRTKSLLFGFRNEKARLFRTDLNGNATPLPGVATGKIFAPSLGYVRDRRDLRLDPSRGSRQQVIVEKSFSILGGDSSFTKIDLDLRHYIPLMKGAKPTDQPKLVLAGRLVVGKSFGQLPAFEQYFIGGSDTVRGYDTDQQFGDNQIYGNLEVRYRLQRKFQIVGFFDIGSAYGGNFSSSGSFNTLTGIGAGIRVQTPIGPIRLDIGKGDDGIRTHFGIGSTF
jgi:outer membrane protein insertion porin family